MEVSLFVSVYILIAFGFYYRDRSFMKNIKKYLQSSVVAPKFVFATAIFIVTLLLPMLALKRYCNNLYKQFSGGGCAPQEDSEEVTRIMKAVYPELLYDMDEVSIELERQDIEAFLNLLIELFDAGFGESQIVRIMRDVETLTIREDNRHVFYPIYQGKRVPIVIEVKRSKKDLFELSFLAVNEVASVIDGRMEVFCE